MIICFAKKETEYFDITKTRTPVKSGDGFIDGN